jgi:gluconolactonase
MRRTLLLSVLIAACVSPLAAAAAELRLVASGFVYTESPTVDRDGNLYFTDYRDGPGKIYRLDTCGGLHLVVANSGRANGLKVSPTGELIACQVDGRVSAFLPDGSGCRVLTGSYCGRRYNAPNDLALDSAGGVYFTDPFLDAPRPFPPQRVPAVYYLAADGCVTRLIDDLRGPNGIVLSPDERTLYVVPSFERHVMAYPVLAPGKLGPGRRFCRLAPSLIPFIPGGDGATVDAAGNLYVATISGVQVFDPAGRLHGVLRMPERPSNLAFGGPDHRTLFITAGGCVYAARGLDFPCLLPGPTGMQAPGPQSPALP